jgi:hypothetical protein
MSSSIGSTVVSDKERVGAIVVTARRHLVSVNPVEGLNRNETTVATRHDFSDSGPGGGWTTAHTVMMVSWWWALVTLPAPRLQKVVI